MRETLNQGLDLINRYGDAFWDFASLMFLQVTLLAVVLFGLDLLLRHKVRAVVRYWIWLLVLAKLLLPTSVRTPASVAYWLPTSETAPPRAVANADPGAALPAVGQTLKIPPTADPTIVTPTTPAPAVANSSMRDIQPPVQIPLDHVAPPPAPSSAHLNGKAIVFGAWLMAVIVLLATVWRRGRKVRGIVSDAIPASVDLQRLLDECLPLVSMKSGRVRLRITDRLGSPAICGMFKPTILLPIQGLDELRPEQIRLIFLHELVHWKRGDLQVNCLQTLLQIFYFYNPAVWFASAMVRRLREEAVDETVLVMTHGEAERYASTLLDLAAFSVRPAESMLRLIGVVESRKALAGRIRRIIGRPTPRTARVGLTGLATILVIGLLLVPMASSDRPVVVAQVDKPTKSTAEPSKASEPVAKPNAVADKKPEVDVNQAKSATANGVLSGRISDETGAPVTDAEIELSLQHKVIGKTKTDADGKYAFEKVTQAGEYRLRVLTQRWVGIGAQNSRDLPRVELNPRLATVRDLTLPRACRLKLEIVDEEGHPIRNAHVVSRLIGDDNQYDYVNGGFTNKLGQTTVNGLKPSADHKHDVAAMSDDYALEHFEITLDNPEAIVERKLVLKKGQPVTGKVLCSDGKPAAGWSINAMPVWWRFAVSPNGQKIEADGSFTLPHVAPEKYNLTVSIPSGGGSSTSKTVLSDVALPGDDGPLAITVDSPSPTAMTKLSGNLQFSGGVLKSGIHVNARSSDGKHFVSTLIRPEDKDFELGPIRAGIYRVDFESTEIEPTELKNVVVPGEALDVKIVVRGTMNLQGTVVSRETGQPIPKFRVQIIKQRTLRGPNYVQEPVWHDFADDQGAFTLDINGPGVYAINVTAEGFAPASLDGINTDNDSAKELKISVSAGQLLTGIVVNEQGQPVDGARVVTFFPGGDLPGNSKESAADKAVLSSAQGEFTIPHYAFGKELLRVTHPDYCAAIVPSVSGSAETGSEPLKVTLLRGATVRGHVYDENGHPLPDTTIFFERHRFRSQSGGTATANELTSATTDDDGRYEVEHLPEDDCFVSRVDDWNLLGVVRQQIRTENGQTQTLDFGGSAKTTGKLIVNGHPLAAARLLLAGESANSGSLRACVRTDRDGKFVFLGLPPGKRTLYYELPGQNEQWVPTKTVSILPQGVDLGTVDSTTIKLAVRCEPPSAANLAEARLTLQEYRDRWAHGPVVGTLLPRLKPSDPFAIDQVPPGKYELICQRPSQFVVRKMVEITAAPEQTIDLTLPTGTASLSGKCDKPICGSDGCRSLKVWSKDQGLLGYIFPKEDGTYRLENIPAGEYLIRRFDTRDAEVILTVSLAEGESKTLDITSENVSQKSMQPPGAYRFVFIYSANGILLPGCEISFPGAEHPPELSSSQDGRLVFMGEAGKYEMTVAYPGFKPVHQMLELLTPNPGTPIPSDQLVHIFLQPE